MRGQIIFRECGAPQRTIPGQASHTYAGIGILETKFGAWPDESHAMMVFTNDGFTIAGNWEKLDPVYREYDLATILTSEKWRKPAAITLLQGGSIITRRTRLSEKPGKEVLLIAMVLSLNGPFFSHQKLFELKGQAEIHLKIEGSRNLDFEPNGMALSQIYKKPIWGWDKERWGPVSTMALPMIDDVMLWERLSDKQRNPDEEVLFQRLERGPAGGFHGASKRDAQYRKFRDLMKAEGYRYQLDGKITESQDAEFSKAADRIVRQIVNAA